MKRNILHLDLDTFFVSCERLLDSSLNNKPVIVGGTGNRGVVSAASYETRGYGVHSGMSMKMARQLCPHATYIRGNAGTYTKFSKLVTEIIQSEVPVLEIEKVKMSSKLKKHLLFSSKSYMLFHNFYAPGY